LTASPAAETESVASETGSRLTISMPLKKATNLLYIHQHQT